MDEINDWICIEDICCGGNIMLDFWADWSPSRALVVFGGAWAPVPNMFADTQPTDDAIHEWAGKHDRAVTDYEFGQWKPRNRG